MNFEKRMIEKAKSLKRSIALPESLDERILKAANNLRDQEIAGDVYLMGNEETIRARAIALSIDISSCTIINPATDPYKEEYASVFFELRKTKGITKEQAKESLLNPLHYATMMTRQGQSHAILAGAVHTSTEVLRAGLTIIRTLPGVKTASSFFIMDTHNPEFGEEGLMLFSDCGMITDPTSEQLAEIAIVSADSFKRLLGKDPRVAMLSFSTKGSASSLTTQKVVEATKLAQKKAPNLLLDGEMQLDAAIIPEVGNRKAPGSKIAGCANVLIFPNLDSGNIGYKLVQRFGRADAYGPLLQGFSYPISDLSRGCSWEEIVTTAALLLTQERG